MKRGVHEFRPVGTLLGFPSVALEAIKPVVGSIVWEPLTLQMVGNTKLLTD